MNKDKLLKEMKKAVKKVRKKNEIDDLFDSNRIAEMSDTPSGTEGVMHKKKEDCECKSESKKDCECEEAAPMDKAEEIVKSIINNFKKISDIYLEKKEKTVSDNHGRYSGPDRRKRSFMTSLKRKSPNNRKIKSKKVIEEKRSKLRRRKSDNLPKNAPDFEKIKQKQAEAEEKAKAAKLKQMHENIEAAGLPEAPKDLAQAENKSIEKKEGKPFHGYNKNKHSVKGGLSKKGREKINREEGSNLKAPVSAKAAKKSKKKASRRKSFCARMSGVKGPTSKKGKLTPKGAALKRWDC